MYLLHLRETVARNCVLLLKLHSLIYIHEQEGNHSFPPATGASCAPYPEADDQSFLPANGASSVPSLEVGSPAEEYIRCCSLQLLNLSLVLVHSKTHIHTQVDGLCFSSVTRDASSLALLAVADPAHMGVSIDAALTDEVDIESISSEHSAFWQSVKPGPYLGVCMGI